MTSLRENIHALCQRGQAKSVEYKSLNRGTSLDLYNLVDCPNVLISSTCLLHLTPSKHRINLNFTHSISPETFQPLTAAKMSLPEERLMFEPRETVGLELSVQQSHIAVKSLHQVQRALACVRKETLAGKAADFDALTSSFREAKDGVESLSRLFSALDPIFVSPYHSW